MSKSEHTIREEKALTEVKAGDVFDLDQIKAFNRAIVYGFEPETSTQFNAQDHPVKTLIHIARQYQDVYDAYLFAQTEVLPAIKQKGIASITSDQLMTWLDECHKRIGSALAIDADLTTELGKVTKLPVYRWHHNGDTHQVLTNCLDQGNFSNDVKDEDIDNFIKQTGKDLFNLGSVDAKTGKLVSKEDLRQFLKLLIRIFQDEKVQLTEEQLQILPELVHKSPGARFWMKLQIQFYDGTLSDSEKTLINQFVKIVRPYAEVERLSQVFVENLLKKWTQCTPKDIDQVVDVVFDAFFQVTDLHRYFNANGRTATWLINIILCSLGWPSILMRDPGEKSNESSQYSQAIALIDTKPELLKKHIKDRVLREKNKPYMDDELATLIKLRVKLGHLFSQITHEFPEFPIDNFYNNIAREQIPLIHAKMSIFGLSPFHPKVQTDSMQTNVQKTDAKLAALRKLKKQTHVSPVVQCAYSTEDTAAIKNKLEELTGKSGWKFYLVEGGIMLLECENKASAEEIAKSLEGLNGFKVKVQFNKKNSKDVVKVYDIKTEKLLAVKKPVVASAQPKEKRLSIT